MIYLSSPYSHPEAAVREARFQEVCRAAARLIADGVVVFSPIAHSHPISEFGQLPSNSSAYWIPFNRRWLSVCDSLTVLTMDGWRESVGVSAEIQMAEEMGMVISYVGWVESDNPSEQTEAEA